MKQININKKQKGFSILAVILVIVAVIVAIGVWALSGQTNTSSSGNSTSDIQTASIINDSGAIKLAFDTLVINGNSANSIILIPNTPSTSAHPNIADPTNGIQITPLSKKSLNQNPDLTAGLWMLKSVDYSGVNPYMLKVAMISGINETICKRLNFQLLGVSTIPELAMGNNNNVWRNPQYNNDDILYLHDLSVVTPYDGQGDINIYNAFEQSLADNIPQGLCISLGDNGSEPAYAFYQILKR